MIATNKIRGLIAERGLTYIQVAGALNITTRTLHNKLKNGSFYVSEADKLISVLGIDNPEAIFFARDLT